MMAGEHALPPSALEGLRDYHLPDAPSWWPPAPGWWISAVLLVALVAIAIYWWRRRTRRLAASRMALRELRLLCERLRGVDDDRLVRELSKLLRRYAIASFPRRDVAALTGEDWLTFLDRHAGAGQFRQGAARLLIDAPYRRGVGDAAAPLASLVEQWIQHNRGVHA